MSARRGVRHRRIQNWRSKAVFANNVPLPPILNSAVPDPGSAQLRKAGQFPVAALGQARDSERRPRNNGETRCALFGNSFVIEFFQNSIFCETRSLRSRPLELDHDLESGDQSAATSREKRQPRRGCPTSLFPTLTDSRQRLDELKGHRTALREFPCPFRAPSLDVVTQGGARCRELALG